MARHGEKVFTHWDFDHRGLKLRIPVKLVDNEKTASRLDDHSTYFLVSLTDPELHERDSDINRLRETVYKQLREKLSVDWQPMLVVEISEHRDRMLGKKQKADTPDTNHNGGTAKLRISWQRWQVATFKGKKLSRSFSNYHKPPTFLRGEPKDEPREVWNRAGEGWPTDKDEHDFRGMHERGCMAMIPDTPENRLALEAVADKLDDIVQRLKFMFAGSRIEQTLKQVAATSLAMLPAPEPKKIVKRKRKTNTSSGT